MGCAESKDISEGRLNSGLNKYMRGKTALVTGGNRGLGKEIVLQLARCGVSIIFNSSKKCEKAQAFAKEVSNLFGIECYYFPCNIRKEAEIDAMVDFAKEKLKKIDILINNAGKACSSPIEYETTEQFNECMEINLYAPMLFAKKISPMMKENKWGRIINFSTGAAKRIMPGTFGYAAAKQGVEALSVCLAKELGQYGITVNTIIPGPMDTDMLNNAIDQYSKHLSMEPEAFKNNVVLSNCIVKEPVQPKNCAEIVLFLCEDSAHSQTAGTYTIDNGMTA